MWLLVVCLIGLWLAPGAAAQENFESWPLLRSTFPSTGGGGIVIKGYDPVITGGKCVTTFMAVEPGTEGGAPLTAAPRGRHRTRSSSRTVCFADRRECALRYFEIRTPAEGGRGFCFSGESGFRSDLSLRGGGAAEAIQKTWAVSGRLDCFVAALLAMTVQRRCAPSPRSVCSLPLKREGLGWGSSAC
jgi:hypothetical protein